MVDEELWNADRIDEIVGKIVPELRSRALNGDDVPSLLRHIQFAFSDKDCKLLSVLGFARAFEDGIASVKPVAGWHGFGGELSDKEVSEFVSPVLDKYRQSQT
jgi:hypothetical protein